MTKFRVMFTLYQTEILASVLVNACTLSMKWTTSGLTVSFHIDVFSATTAFYCWVFQLLWRRKTIQFPPFLPRLRHSVNHRFSSKENAGYYYNSLSVYWKSADSWQLLWWMAWNVRLYISAMQKSYANSSHHNTAQQSHTHTHTAGSDVSEGGRSSSDCSGIQHPYGESERGWQR